jgi:predicted transglutaminase-like cysteine proteinase
MLFTWSGRLGLVAILLAASGAAAGASSTRLSPFMNLSGDTGHLIAACLAHPDGCSLSGKAEEQVALTSDKWAELVAVNNAVNAADVRPPADADVLHRVAVSSCPVDRDNCENRVLAKRSLLLRKGWPAGALLVTVVRQRNGDQHTVLTVVTDRGDLVLDNREAHVLVWSETAYRYLRRQSSLGDDAWVAIEDAPQSAEPRSLSN